MFSKGISQSLTQYKVAPATITAYLASPVATLKGTQEEKLEQVILQKFLANYLPDQ
jgi:hypothetical protein